MHSYDAYGMTIIEAAAFGAPTLIDQGGLVGASSRLRPSHGEAIAAPLTNDDGSPSAAVAAKVPGEPDETHPTRSTLKGVEESAVAAAAAGATRCAFSCNGHCGEALLKALADPKALAVVGERAKVRALEWDADAFGRALISILGNATKNRNPND